MSASLAQRHRARRGEPQFLNIHGLDWAPGGELALLDSAESRLLSYDETTDASTSMVRLSAGWRATASAEQGTLEVFVADGDLTVDGAPLGVSGYVDVPTGVDCELGSANGAQVFLFANPTGQRTTGAGVRFTRAHAEPWVERSYPHAPHAGFYRSLRSPCEDLLRGDFQGPASGFLRMYLMSPGHADPREHIHEVWEGMIFLAGDMLLAGSGRVAPRLLHGESRWLLARADGEPVRSAAVVRVVGADRHGPA